MVKTLAINFGNIAVTILAISFILYVVKFRKLPKEIKIIGLFLSLNLLTEILSRSLSGIGENNLYLLHIYTLFEFLVWSLFYKYLFNKKEKNHNYYWPSVFLIAVLLILNSMFLEPISGFNSNAKTLVQLILIGYAVIYFFNSFGKTDFSTKENQSILLINFAIILYYSGSLFIFMFAKLLETNDVSPLSFDGFWLFNALLNAIFQLLILVSIWKVAFSKTKSLS